MARYVPPALRRRDDDQEREDAAAGVNDSTTTNNTDDASRSLEALALSHNKQKYTGALRYTVDEVHEYFRPAYVINNPASSFKPCPPSTLNNSVGHEDELGYIILFPDANPRWESDCIIYAKSNMELLPGMEGLVQRGWTDGGGLKKFKGGKPMDRGRHWRDNKNEATNDQAAAGESATEQAKSGAVEDAGKNSTTTTMPQPSTDAESTAQAPMKPTHHPLVDYDDEDSEAAPTQPPPHDSMFDVIDHRMIPVFQQVNRSYRSVEFIGYYQMKKVSYLRPRSRALIKMLELKFGSAAPQSTSNESQTNDQGNAKEEGQSVAGTTEPKEGQSNQPSRPKSGDRHPRLGEGPAMRSTEAWGRSLSVPWVSLQMKLYSRPEPNAEDKQKEEEDFWNTVSAADKAPSVDVHPEKDGDYYKKAKEDWKARKAWRMEHGLHPIVAPQIERHPEKDAEHEEKALNSRRGGHRGGGRGWGRGGLDRGGRGGWGDRVRGRSDNGNRGRGSNGFGGFNRGRGGHAISQATPTDGQAEGTLFQTGSSADFQPTDEHVSSNDWGEPASNGGWGEPSHGAQNGGQTNGGAEVGKWDAGW